MTNCMEEMGFSEFEGGKGTFVVFRRSHWQAVIVMRCQFDRMEMNRVSSRYILLHHVKAGGSSRLGWISMLGCFGLISFELY